MAVSSLNRQQGHIPMGQNGRLIEWGTAAFSTTDTSGTVAVNMTRVEAVLITAADTTAADEIISWDNALGATGVYAPTDGTITVVRTGASPTSGLEFSYLIIGY